MPNVVCVRSLVPNEKNSAVSRDLAGHQRRARQLDHGADLVVELRAGLLHHRLRHRVDARLDDVELGLGRDQRHHDLRHHRLAGALAGLDRGLEDRARLHLGDLGIGDGDAAAAEAEHRIELGKLVRAMRELLRIDAHRGGDLGDLLLAMRQELVQRRIEQPDRHRQALHDLEQLDEIAALHRQELGERRAPRLLVVGEDHLAHRLDARLVEEHVLGAAEPDAFGAEACTATRASAGVSALARTPSLRTLSAQPISVPNSPDMRGLGHRHGAGQHLAGRAVDGDDLAALEHVLPACRVCAL